MIPLHVSKRGKFAPAIVIDFIVHLLDFMGPASFKTFSTSECVKYLDPLPPVPRPLALGLSFNSDGFFEGPFNGPKVFPCVQ